MSTTPHPLTIENVSFMTICPLSRLAWKAWIEWPLLKKTFDKRITHFWHLQRIAGISPITSKKGMPSAWCLRPFLEGKALWRKSPLFFNDFDGRDENRVFDIILFCVLEVPNDTRTRVYNSDTQCKRDEKKREAFFWWHQLIFCRHIIMKVHMNSYIEWPSKTIKILIRK